jgi:RNA polymerase sigma factor (sigma-70 family)
LDEKDRVEQHLLKVAQDLQRELKSSFRKYASNAADRDDLMQVTYERLLSPGIQETIKAPERYIRRAAARVGIDLARQRRPEPHLPLESATDEELWCDQPGVFDLVALEQERAILRQIMQMLPSKCREVFQLNREEGLSYVAIAERLNISVNTVKNHLAHAVLVFHRELERFNYEGLSGNGNDAS